jgi:hypothetical protein
MFFFCETVTVSWVSEPIPCLGPVIAIRQRAQTQAANAKWYVAVPARGYYCHYAATALAQLKGQPPGERGTCSTVSFIFVFSPTPLPEDMDDSVAIAMEERDGVQGNMQSLIPSVAALTQGGSTTASSGEDGLQEVSSNAEVRFCFSAVE